MQFQQIFGRPPADETELLQAKGLWDVAVAIDRARQDIQLHPWLTCIRRYESDGSGYPYTGGYQAQNPSSSASGASQMIKSTYDTLVARAGLANRGELANHPWYEQDAIALWAYNNGWAHHWPWSC